MRHITAKMLSRPLNNLELADEAKEDIRDIAAYTLRTYGELQADSYVDDIYNTLIAIQYNPLIGHFRVDLPEEYKAMISGRHVIVYTFKQACVYVARILHDRMDIPHHFPRY